MKEAPWSDHEPEGAVDELDRLVEAEITILERLRVPRPAPRPQADFPSADRREDDALAPEEQVVIDRMARWLRTRPDPALLLRALSATVEVARPAARQVGPTETEVPPESPNPQASSL